MLSVGVFFILIVASQSIHLKVVRYSENVDSNYLGLHNGSIMKFVHKIKDCGHHLSDLADLKCMYKYKYAPLFYLSDTILLLILAMSSLSSSNFFFFPVFRNTYIPVTAFVVT